MEKTGLIKYTEFLRELDIIRQHDKFYERLIEDCKKYELKEPYNEYKKRDFVLRYRMSNEEINKLYNPLVENALQEIKDYLKDEYEYKRKEYYVEFAMWDKINRVLKRYGEVGDRTWLIDLLDENGLEEEKD